MFLFTIKQKETGEPRSAILCGSCLTNELLGQELLDDEYIEYSETQDDDTCTLCVEAAI